MGIVRCLKLIDWSRYDLFSTAPSEDFPACNPDASQYRGDADLAYVCVPLVVRLVFWAQLDSCSSGGLAQAAARAKATEVPTQPEAGDPLGGSYGDLPLVASAQTSGCTWTPIQELTAAKDGEMVRISAAELGGMVGGGKGKTFPCLISEDCSALRAERQLP